MAREAVAATIDRVPSLIAWDAPCFRGASRAAQRTAVMESGGTEYAPGGQIGGRLLADGSVEPAVRGVWLLPGEDPC